MESHRETETKEGFRRKRRRLYEPLEGEAATEVLEPAEKEEPAAVPTDRQSAAHQLINKYVCWSAGAGLIPMPVVDIAVLTGVHLKMIHEMCRLYDVPFSRERAKSIVAALVGSVGAMSVSRGVLGAAFWMIPLMGPALYMLLSPVVAGAATFAVGRVFLEHYELGGTLLNFNPNETKAYFAEQFRAGKVYVARMDQQDKSK